MSSRNFPTPDSDPLSTWSNKLELPTVVLKVLSGTIYLLLYIPLLETWNLILKITIVINVPSIVYQKSHRESHRRITQAESSYGIETIPKRHQTIKLGVLLLPLTEGRRLQEIDSVYYNQ